ncbi:threonine synthase [Luteipulveratus sp. YIM 133132]|uniref:threonine synthase n=1 Tax=Luteipulveratus flavus TaxID=3031728 RepID=UPI0023B1EDB8|nr:threonine synthase [Luteipulveratus sp. YIM 133132]MDE9364329.1 threonine synthase [Luteipulveratus sp. YIM 133132]
MRSALTHLECSDCGREHDADRLQNLCECGGPLLARYDLEGVTVTPDEIARRPRGIWRWAELLPVRDEARRLTLGEGETPLLNLPSLGLRGLVVKDEGLNPTGSFKARGAAVGAARAAELGATHVALPTNGNAGAAWAAYGRRHGLDVTVAVPATAPAVTHREARAAGADVQVVDGLIGDAGRLVGRAAAARDWFDVSTLKEPYRVEGKKTMGLEIAEQLGWRAPEVVVYPTGGGVGLIGIAKAFAELRELGWLTGPTTRFVAAQSSGCAPVVDAFERGADDVEPFPNPETIAYGITVAGPLGGRQVLRALRAGGGTAVAVDDEDALATRDECACGDGLLLSPEGAVAVHAARVLADRGWVACDERIVVMGTGSPLVQPELLPVPTGLIARDGELRGHG